MYELGQVVPVAISDKLQSQIIYMCKEVWSDEWSGMLFYETEGQFGEENFKITAQELFPLDIGSQTYTEYEANDPDLIRFLMNNPHARTMKKGHIHSHNTMGVFFSTTDDSELHDNCGAHNFYLSLIVNNKNEMCAKIAFKATSKSETKTLITFRDEKGQEKTKSYSGSKEDERIYIYKCSITNPHGVVEDSFKSRFQGLKDDKKKKEDAKRMASYQTSKALQSSPINGKYRETGLFDSLEESSGYTKKQKNEEVDSQRPRNTYVDSAKKKDRLESGNQRGGLVERPKSLGMVEKHIYSFLSKLLAQDHLYEGTLTHILRKMDNEFYTEEGLDPQQAFSAGRYYESIENRIKDFYAGAFPEDTIMTNYFASIDKSICALELYQDDYPHFVKEIISILNMELI